MILAGIEKQLNKVIALDEEALANFSRLEGKVIQLEFLNTRASYYLYPGRRGLHISVEKPGKVDVTISGTPTDLLALLLRRDESLTPASAGVELAGDIGLAQDFQRVCREIDIDWEEGLSHWFGDAVAHHLGRFVRGAAGFITESGDKVQADISEYLRFEKELSVERFELEGFSSDVDTLRDDIERLKLRVERLQQEKNRKHSSC